MLYCKTLLQEEIWLCITANKICKLVAIYGPESLYLHYRFKTLILLPFYTWTADLKLYVASFLILNNRYFFSQGQYGSSY